MHFDILIVDDEIDIRTMLSDILKDEKYNTRLASTGEMAIDELNARRPNVVILDVFLGHGRMDGLDVLDFITKHYPDVPVLMISGHGTVETAVAAIKRGAYDFIEKPFQIDKLLLLTKHAIENAKLKAENAHLKMKLGSNHEAVGVSASMGAIQKAIIRVAPTESRVFLSGPPGVGKALTARRIHDLSKRADGPFVSINCATFDGHHLEENLFGIEQDVSGGRKVGVFEQAHLGTLYLGEVTEIPFTTQAKIMRALQEHQLTRLGGSRNVQVDVRIISSTCVDIQEEIAAKRFREDLFYRLNVVPIVIQPLKNRTDDIEGLVSFFMEHSAQTMGVKSRQLSQEALLAMKDYPWPGNVRELRNTVDRLLIMSPGDEREMITIDMLPPEIRGESSDFYQLDGAAALFNIPLREAREAFERQYLVTQISRFSGNISQTAKFVGMERSALHRKLKALSLEREDDTSFLQDVS